MLRRNSSDSNLILTKGSQAILKHKIRNLRAKLKNLLSNDSCSKYSKRQKIVQKLQGLQNNQFNQTNFLFNHTKQLFTHTKDQPKKYWYAQRKNCNIMNVFGKLTTDQIQQIKEDMIYYLGQENVQTFKSFLVIKQQKKGNKQNMTNPLKRLKTLQSEEGSSRVKENRRQSENTQRKEFLQLGEIPRFAKNCSLAERFTTNFRPSFQSNNSNNISNFSNKRLKTANLIQSRTSTIAKRSRDDRQGSRMKFQVSYLGNRQNFIKKRQIIEQQQSAQRILTKVNMQMKQQKAKDIFRGTTDAFLSTIKQKNTVNDTKTKKILEDKYKKNVTFGTIVELNQQLRKIYIKKISSPTALNIPNYNNFQDEYRGLIDGQKRNYDTTVSSFFSPANYNYKYS